MSKPRRVVAFGEMLQERQIVEGVTTPTGWGGDTLATMAALAALLKRFGLPIGVDYFTGLGPVGDEASDDAISLMNSLGVGTERILRTPERTIGSYTINRNAEGEQVPDPNTGDRWSFDRFSSAATQICSTGSYETTRTRVLEGASVLFLSMISVVVLKHREGGAGKGDMERLFSLLEEAKRQGISIVLSTNLRPALWEFEPDAPLDHPGKVEARTALERVLPLVDMVFSSKGDEDMLYGDVPANDHIRRIQTHGASSVFITDGAEGVYYANDGNLGVSKFTAASEEECQPKATDAGCGDAFAAGILAGYLVPLLPEKRLELGHAMGAAAYKSPRAILREEDLPDLDFLYH